MANLKWIKILTDIFDDEKMVLIDSLPERDAIIVIWFKILCLAGKQNNCGVFLLNERVPFTDEMLATIFRRPVNIVRLALSVFEQFGMIEVVNHVYTIPNWEKHQAQDKLEAYRENTRKRVASYRERQKLLANGGPCNVTVTECNDAEDSIENTKHIELDLESNSDSGLDLNEDTEDCDCRYVLDSYHELCVSLPVVKMLTESRKKSICSCLKMFSLNEIRDAFEKAEASPFLKGCNESGWKANFDWIMKLDHLAKIIEGFYDGRSKGFNEASGHRELDEDEVLAIHRIMCE